MKIVNIKDLKNTSREVKFPCGMISNRILLKHDNMGFTLTQTNIPAGDWRHWHYKYHLEACYCISGNGIICNLDNNKSYDIYPGVTYILDNHDDHQFKAISDVILLCVFNPPLNGNEKHLIDGSYIAT